MLAPDEAGQLHSLLCRLSKTLQSCPVVWRDVTCKEMRGVEDTGLWTGRGAQELRGWEREEQRTERGLEGLGGGEGGERSVLREGDLS